MAPGIVCTSESTLYIGSLKMWLRYPVGQEGPCFLDWPCDLGVRLPGGLESSLQWGGAGREFRAPARGLGGLILRQYSVAIMTGQRFLCFLFLRGSTYREPES